MAFVVALVTTSASVTLLLLRPPRASPQRPMTTRQTDECRRAEQRLRRCHTREGRKKEGGPYERTSIHRELLAPVVVVSEHRHCYRLSASPPLPPSPLSVGPNRLEAGRRGATTTTNGISYGTYHHHHLSTAKTINDDNINSTSFWAAEREREGELC